MTRAELKQKAKESLKGKYGDAIAVTLLLFIISGVIGGISGFIMGVFNINEQVSRTITEIISIVLSGLLTFGYYSYFLKISRNENADIQELWSKTNMFLPYIIASILIGLFTTLWTFLFIIPGIIAAFSYSMTYYIMLDNPEISALDAIRKSKELMKGHRFDYFILNLSFIGWILLGILTCGILYVWLIPYMNVTNLNFYNQLLENN